jgi:hypothetical protein
MIRFAASSGSPGASPVQNLRRPDRNDRLPSRTALALLALAVAGGGCSSRSSSGPGTLTGGTAGSATGGSGGGAGGRGGTASGGGGGGGAGSRGGTAGGGKAGGGIGGGIAGGGTAGGGKAGGGMGGGAAGGGGAGGGAVDPSCRVDAAGQAPPYPTEIHFRNDSGAPIYVHQGCIGIDFGVSSCASGYHDFLEPVFHCACACEQTSCTGGLACGACPQPVGTAIAPGHFATVAWNAIAVTEENRGSYSCVRSTALSAGRYRIAMRVYDDATSAMNMVGGREVTQDFSLPTTTGVLEVPLGTVQADPCAAPSTTATPVCTGGEAHDQACRLASSMRYGAEGGLGVSSDVSAIAPPATYTLTRTFSTPASPDQQCTAALPLCSRDAHVVTTGDLTRVLTTPTVTAAFGTDTPVFGVDSRPYDGRILVLHRPDGASLGIGDAGPTSPVPAPIADVKILLGRLDAQMASDPACASLAH